VIERVVGVGTVDDPAEQQMTVTTRQIAAMTHCLGSANPSLAGLSLARKTAHTIIASTAAKS
jgi:hypothetical protein